VAGRVLAVAREIRSTRIKLVTALVWYVPEQADETTHIRRLLLHDIIRAGGEASRRN
jgi:hypothetical protein